MYDILIMGGGINGCGIARDAAGRGLSVLLAEKADLASGTSSASTKLIHGGLRYLEHYAFRLVREALREREVLLSMAPHLVRPLRFVLPHHRGLRPAWLIRLGLFLYDRLGGRSSVLPASGAVDLTRAPAGKPLQASFTRGFEYSDCWVDDARLVVLNAIDAAARDADIRVRTEVVSARRAKAWRVDLRDTVSGERDGGSARAHQRYRRVDGETSGIRVEARPVASVRLVKGSHIVVPRLFEHNSAYIFQNPDRRIVFAIPYETDFTLIGTTDVDCAGDLDNVAASDEEIEYLCGAVNAYFTTAVAPSDVVWSYAGVRSLHDDGAPPPRIRRATSCWSWTAAAASRRWSASSAARSPPIAVSPRRRCGSSYPPCRAGPAPPGRAERRCPAATSPGAITTGWRAISLPPCRPSAPPPRIVWSGPTERWREPYSQTPGEQRISAYTSAPGFTSAR
jgi:glycerol-3-phosphate dehydrogenase